MAGVDRQVPSESLLDALIAELGDDQTLHQMAEQLLGSDDPMKTIEEWLNYWKVQRTY